MKQIKQDDQGLTTDYNKNLLPENKCFVLITLMNTYTSVKDKDTPVIEVSTNEHTKIALSKEAFKTLACDSIVSVSLMDFVMSLF